MQPQQSSAGQPPGLHRVKLYKLNETGGWDDKGTGLVSIGPMEFANHASNSVGLVVIGEETQKMLMVHRILHEDIYNRQGTLRVQAWHMCAATGCLTLGVALTFIATSAQTRPSLLGLIQTLALMWRLAFRRGKAAMPSGELQQ